MLDEGGNGGSVLVQLAHFLEFIMIVNTTVKEIFFNYLLANASLQFCHFPPDWNDFLVLPRK
jgi:hypothetical protein